MKSLLIVTLFLWSIEGAADTGTFRAFDTILEKYIKTMEPSDGSYQTAFQYQRLKASEHAKLVDQQKQLLQQFDTSTLKDKNSTIAFWINAYNFFMISIILEQGFEGSKLKINSVKDFGSFFNPYKIFQKQICNIGNKKYSLDQIEKKILLGEDFKKKGWKDARIHFAVNCASVGCPPLISKAYTAKNLDAMLDDNIKKALKTRRHFHIKGNTLYLTHLFKWYKTDFEEHSGSIKDFLSKYLDKPNVIKQTSNIEFIEYDWKLNKPNNF